MGPNCPLAPKEISWQKVMLLLSTYYSFMLHFKKFSESKSWGKSCIILAQIGCKLLPRNFFKHFLQPISDSKNSILKLSLFMFAFSFLFSKHPWKISHSLHLFFLAFGFDTYKLTKRKVVWIILVNFSSKLTKKLIRP